MCARLQQRRGRPRGQALLQRDAAVDGGARRGQQRRRARQRLHVRVGRVRRRQLLRLAARRGRARQPARARPPGSPGSMARMEAGWSGRPTPPSHATSQRASQCSTLSQVCQLDTLYGRPPLAPRLLRRASQPGDSTVRRGSAAQSATRACPAARARGAGQSPRRCACARASRPPSRPRRRRPPPAAAASAGPPTPAHRLPQQRARSLHNTAPPPARPAAASLAACCPPTTCNHPDEVRRRVVTGSAPHARLRSLVAARRALPRTQQLHETPFIVSVHLRRQPEARR